MASLRLSNLDAPLREQCLNLRVRPEQVEFVPGVAASLELASRYPDARPMAILVDEKVIGFTMHGIDQSSGSWKIYRLIIDAGWQGMGFGRAALQELVRTLERETGATSVLVSYNEENESARRLYRSEGFHEVSVVDGKVTACRRGPEGGTRSSARDRQPDLDEADCVSVTLGAEHDAALWARLESAVAARGGCIVESSYGVAGSQEVILYEVHLPEGRLQLTAETYVGLVLKGPARLVEWLSRDVRGA